MPSLHPTCLSTKELLLDCEIKTTRRGGPGGQHRNKVDSAVVITHVPSQLIGQAGERRSQHENREVAIDRLRLNLAMGIRLERQSNLPPSERWQSRVQGQRISVNPQHHEFPALLAEALDFIYSENFEMTTVAKRLQVSSSQLVKFLKSFPPALQLVNQKRIELGMGALK
jgi:hypothetical protein